MKDHFSEGSVTMHIMFLTLCLGSSLRANFISYIVFFSEILITNQFNHYPNLDIIISLNIPCALAITVAQYVLLLGALDHYLMVKELEHISTTDELTQIGNRVYLDQILTSPSMLTNPVSFAILDIDYFKQVNDQHGHLLGDQTLIYLAQFLKKTIREKDYVIRYGGEEFIIIFNNLSLDESYDYMDKIRAELSLAQDKPISFTISAGLAPYNSSYEQTMHLADTALYHAKNQGRNCVCKTQ